MKEKLLVTIFIFRRDLRVKDNVALNMLSESYPGIPIVPIFIFDKQQATSKNRLYNPYVMRFMIECLHELNEKDLANKLITFHGGVFPDVEVLEHLLTYVDVQCVAWNDDHTPFAKKRDAAIQEFCKRRNINVLRGTKEYTLFGFDEVTTQGKPYRVYTPFYRKCIGLTPNKPRTQKTPPFFASVKETFMKSKYCTSLDEYLSSQLKNTRSDPHNHMKGGRESGLVIIEKIKKGEWKEYDKYRDFPHPNRTTRMAPYLKFGCISIREAYWACREAYGLSHGLVRELIWREFYAHIAYHFPEILRRQIFKSTEPNMEFNKKYSNLQWHVDKIPFDRWCNGMTGFPFIDAAMRCLKDTGYMHNRLRMLVASFLTKDLRIDWRLGEEYFAKTLLDYDPASNSGGWQWAAGVGADAQPYFRVFSPWVQSSKYDKDAIFIKQWLPELTEVPASHIHAWHQKHMLYKDVRYPAPCVNHTEEVKTTIKWFTSSGGAS